MFANPSVSFSLFAYNKDFAQNGLLDRRETISQHPSSPKADISLCMATLQRLDTTPFKASLTFGSSTSYVHVSELIVKLVGARHSRR